MTRTAMVELIERGGFATPAGSLRAALHILIAVDGVGAYANTDARDSNTDAREGAGSEEIMDLGDLVIETAETHLGLAPGTVRERARAHGVE
ncbi:hypothetical protein [Streptomyces sp. KLOTTS4A1]|uniref:hypothetical protein n=1 Tax=Streptomyces sp. KLOTTS4A1 TaxID=3390996 RepID=UPI0039F5C8B2